ncbi:hypothetical protein [Streptomyces sp. NBC_01187]|uniref:hypothetical protein n=1 Tax=Streptomyces sp. NBC_01187 TaxID=2903766 RepID=UPI00386C9472|nr:hypothetical protein OG220_40560 [Streptomyces sp. NBC_01187]WSS46932.1 hypothetical protein OG220_41065 [Streptomyces sp. NBC_01187]
MTTVGEAEPPSLDESEHREQCREDDASVFALEDKDGYGDAGDGSDDGDHYGAFCGGGLAVWVVPGVV